MGREAIHPIEEPAPRCRVRRQELIPDREAREVHGPCWQARCPRALANCQHQRAGRVRPKLRGQLRAPASELPPVALHGGVTEASKQTDWIDGLAFLLLGWLADRPADPTRSNVGVRRSAS